MFDPKNPMLKEILDEVESGRMQLPDFQRGWVWNDERIRQLLASVSQKYPIGTIMTVSVGGDVMLKSNLVEGVRANLRLLQIPIY